MRESRHNEKIFKAMEEAGASRIGGAERERLEIFIGELELWSVRIHLVGKGNIPRTLTSQFVDSYLMLAFAQELQPLGKGADSGHEPAGKACGELDGKREVRVADIGAGAGFPGVVWKVFRPDLDVTLFERRRKPADFLERILTLLSLKGIRVNRGDASKEGVDARCHVVVSKASGRLHELMPIAGRMLGHGGAYITVKGAGVAEELAEAPAAGFSLEASRALPGGRGSVLCFRKRQ
jgi:16S rRNA (guanine(527)-N(7))-methyltransferase RsmG